MGWNRLRVAVQMGVGAGMDAWKNGPPGPDIESIQRRYIELEMVASGKLFTEYAATTQWKKDPRVYKGISLLWNHTSRVPNFYGMLVYQGRLSTEPNQGAIPIVPDESLSNEEIANLMTAIGVFYRRWNWQRAMKLRPRKSSALGDWPTELIDDQDRNFIYPRSVWPGYVTEVELDPVGNVETYTIEHMVSEEDGDKVETYRYKKVVTPDSFEFFKDGKPFAYDGQPASYKNPYGFAPMIWDRHIDNGIDDRGESAFAATMQPLMHLNSLASHARDAQHKNFLAPVVVSGKMTASKQSRIDLGIPKIVSQNAPEQRSSAMAEQHHFIEADPGVGLHQPQLETSETLEYLKWLQEGILEAHPEITFFEKMADKSQLSALAVTQFYLPMESLVEDARDGLDPNTVHMLQMAISMAGYRVNTGSWGRELRNGRDAFRPFNLESYDAGKLEFTIGQRPVLPVSVTEVMNELLKLEGIRSRYGLRTASEKLGYDLSEEDITDILESRSLGQWRSINGGSYADLMADDGDSA